MRKSRPADAGAFAIGGLLKPPFEARKRSMSQSRVVDCVHNRSVLAPLEFPAA
jgi:hypothetical protein